MLCSGSRSKEYTIEILKIFYDIMQARYTQWPHGIWNMA